MLRAAMILIGLVLAGGALYPTWRGFDSHHDIRAWENEIVKIQSEMIRNKKKEDERIGEAQTKIEECTRDRNLWSAAAGGALIFGLGLVLLPSSSRRKRSVDKAAESSVADEPSA